MFGSLFIVFVIFALFSMVRAIKIACEPEVHASHWANKELIHEDTMLGISEREFIKNLKRGKYKLVETYPRPHVAKGGGIIIENYDSYCKDLRKYGAVQTQKFVRQGKYNL